MRFSVGNEWKNWFSIGYEWLGWMVIYALANLCMQSIEWNIDVLEYSRGDVQDVIGSKTIVRT